MLDLFGGMSLGAAMLALDMGVFATLDDGAATAAELADRNMTLLLAERA